MYSDPAAIEASQAAVSANGLTTLVLTLVVLAAGVNIFRGSSVTSLALAAIFVAMIPVLALLGYHAATPFLVLGAVVLAASAFVFAIFERARAIGADE